MSGFGTVHEYFTDLNSYFVPAKAKKADFSYWFEITGDGGGDYTVTLSPDILNRTDRMRVDVRILCQFPAAPALFNYTGFALITWPNRPVKMPQLNFGFGNQGDIIVEGFLAPGPNPPPPPPLHCSAQPTKADCVKQPPGINDYCTWCVRKDGSGGGCFEDDAEPPAAGWDCPI